MKKIIYLLLVVSLTACTSVKQIGKVNMISNRNIDPNLKYKLVSSYSGGSNRELKRSRAKNIEEAVDQTVRKVPGAEFLMNVKIYKVNEQYYAVEGDAWGSLEQITYRGFKIGDKVIWKPWKEFNTGTITSLKDDRNCLVLSDKDSKTIELSYDEISKYDGQKSNVQLIEEKKEKQQQKLEHEKLEKQKLASNFIIGDNVTWKKFGKFYQGKIIGVNSENAVISYNDANGKAQIKDVVFENLTKINIANETKENQNLLNNETAKNDEKKELEKNDNLSKKQSLKEEIEVYKVSSDFVNVRSGAGLNYKILFKIYKGNSVQLIEKINTDWWKIKYNERIGYASSKYLLK